MKTFNQILDSTGKSIINTFPKELSYLLEQNMDNGIVEITLKDKNYKSRFGFIENEKGKLKILSTDEKHVKSNKNFKELCNISFQTLENIIDYRNDISLNQNEYVQDLIHNLTSLNTYNIQDLFSLIPQKTLTENINTQKDIIKDLVIEKPYVTANTILNLIKYNFAMKVEFSVFEKTIIQNPKVQKLEYSIREIVLSILQIFIDEFKSKNILVSVGSNSKRLFLDYDILFVSLFYILENAIKYCAGSSDFKIIFREEGSFLIVIFDMVSVKIEDDEVSKLCNKKFRAKSAIQLTDKGNGIGMNRILKTLKLNNAELEIIPRITNYKKTIKNIEYNHNQFRIKFDSNRIF